MAVARAARPKSKTTRDTDLNDLIEELREGEEITYYDPEMASLQRELLELYTEFRDLSLDMEDQQLQLEDYDKTGARVDLMEQVVYHLAGGYCQYMWRLDRFKERLQLAANGKDPVIYSPSFSTHRYGYHMACSLCPYGDGEARGTFMSLFFCLIKSEYDALLPWPFQSKIVFTIIDMQEDESKREPIVKSVQITPNKGNMRFLTRPTSTRNASIGIPRFIKLSDIFSEKNRYILNDSIFVRINVDVSNLLAI